MCVCVCMCVYGIERDFRSLRADRYWNLPSLNLKNATNYATTKCVTIIQPAQSQVLDHSSVSLFPPVRQRAAKSNHHAGFDITNKTGCLSGRSEAKSALVHHISQRSRSGRLQLPMRHEILWVMRKA